jgi:DUF1009 family protein
MDTDLRGGCLGILAGGGLLPRRLAEAAQSGGRPVFIIAFEGQTDPATVDGLPHRWVRLGQTALTIGQLKQAGVSDLVMAGPVRRPSLSELGLDWRGVQLFARIGARALGDDGLLRAIARELESEGFRLIGLHVVLAELLAPAGALGRCVPDDQANADIVRGVEVARALGLADVGQAVVVQQGLVLGVEAIEGTDALLDRTARLARGGPGGVLVKIPKPQQDRRIDLPMIGPATIARAAAAGLRGVAVEAGGTILADRAAAIEAADRAGLFIVGIKPAEPGGVGIKPAEPSRVGMKPAEPGGR